jgi:Zn-dependent metalloprotease
LIILEDKMRKHKLIKIANVLMAILISVVLVFSDLSQVQAASSLDGVTPPKHDPASRQQLNQCISSQAETAYNALTGKIRFIGTGFGKPIQQSNKSLRSASPEAAARGYLAECGSLLGLSNQAAELTVKRQTKTADGRSVIRFQQVYQGIPVVGGDLVMQLNAANDIVMVNGEILPDIKLDIKAGISAAAAQQGALGLVAGKNNISSAALKVSAPQLWIYNPVLSQAKSGPTLLVWRMEVRPMKLAPIRELVLLDAHSGSVVLNFNQVDNARDRETYNLDGATSGSGTLVCDESDPTCAGGGSDTDAVNAHVYGGDTYDFYANYHGRDSLDNAGMTLYSYVHYDTGYCNAFWDGYEMTYGDGCFIVVDDVVAHEMTHGVTSNESNLDYSYQSGAINESFSDIWGEFVDLTNGKGTDTPAVRWLMGEDTSIGAIRDMKDPTTFGDPDRMGSPLYYTGSGDNGGVHYNSGVGNKAAYLITDGDTFNGYTVTGLGITKTAQIYYEAQTNILTSTSNYGDLYNALFQACTNLIGTSGITTDDCAEVRKATDATEMTPAGPPANDDFDTPELITSLPYTNVQDTTAATTAGDDPDLICAGSQKYNSVWYSYTPVSSQTVSLNTVGSNYDTLMAVWTGSRGSLDSVACNDDALLTSQLAFDATEGVTYYIEVVGYSSGGGSLTLNAPDLNNPLQDPSFEASIGSSLYWAQSSTNFGTPLCSVAGCGDGGGTAGPRTGAVWSWFGGTSYDETGSLSQTVTFPSGSAALGFYLWIGSAGAGSDAADVFTAKIDGTTVFSANATQASAYPTYTLIEINVSSFADGASHTVTFSSVTTGQSVNFNLDDVSLTDEVIPSPDISVTPTSFAVTLAQGQSTTRTMAIGNVGDAVLTYTIAKSNALTATISDQGIPLKTPTNGYVLNGIGHAGKAPLINVPEVVYVEPLASSVINFDNTTQPCGFDETTALREAYAALGVHFAGPATLDGGGILDACSDFSVAGYSAPNFLAFNTGAVFSNGGVSRPPEKVTFDAAASYVEAKVGSYTSAGSSLTLTAFNAAHTQIGIATVTLSSTLQVISVSAPGISSVEFSTPAAVFVLDDLGWNGAPLNWLSASPVSGSVNPSGSQNITVQFNTSGLTPGTYHANLFIASNDPDENPVTIPVTLVVTPVTYTIAGNAGAPGVTLSRTGGSSVTAASNGSYSITVPYGWSGTVTPAKTGYTFTPVNRSYTNVLTNQTGQNYSATLTLTSTGTQDGWVLESSETSNKGGTMNSAAATFNLGDNAARKQYRGILSFSTGANLPDNAVITAVTLKLKKSAVVGGGNPVAIFRGFMFDIKNGFFGTAPSLQAADFQALASKSYGPFNTALAGGWYSINLTGASAYVNKAATNGGLTQIRLRFGLDDNNNAIANYLSFYSGNTATAAYRPQLVITYTLP